MSDTVKTIDELEEEATRLYGPTQFDWVIGRCPEGWFYYAGTAETKGTLARSKARWAVNGTAGTIRLAMEAMIEAHGNEVNKIERTTNTRG